MATCKDIQPDLCAYADGESPIEARARVATHIAACAACRDELRLLEATGRLLLAYERETRAAATPRPGLAARVRARVAAEERTGRVAGGSRVLRAPAPAWKRALPWAVAAAVLLGAGVVWRGSMTSPDGARGSGASLTASASAARTTGGSTSQVSFQPLAPRAPLAPPEGRRPEGESVPSTDGASGSAVATGGLAGPEGARRELTVPEEGAVPDELLAKLDLLESWDLVESMELLDALEDPVDPTQGLPDEENG